jgi:uncharacterized membrane protein
MKGLVAGILVWTASAATLADGIFLGFILGVVVTYVIWRADGLDRRLRSLEAASHPALTSEARAVAVGEAPPPPPPASTLSVARGPVVGSEPQLVAMANRTEASGVRAAASARRPLLSMEDLEGLLAGRVLAVVGGLALLVGGIFFLGLAFSRGWIGPEARVILGLVVGSILFGIGMRLLLRPGNATREILGLILIAVGLAVISLGLFAATRLYGLVAPELGVAGALMAAAIAAAAAIRTRSQLVAGFGLVAVLAAPPVMGAGATILTVVFLGVAMAGATAICLFASWRWLPTAAFLLTAPQLAFYLREQPSLAIGLAALIVFWVLNTLSAAGEELRKPSQRLSATSATLIVANGAFAVWAGFALLSGTLEPWRGLYLVGLSIAHLAVGTFFVRRNGERHPFGMLAFGTGVASLTLAIPVQVGAPWVPMAWAAEAVAMAWVYAEREHIYSGAAGAVLGALAVGHVLFDEYGLLQPTAPPAPGAIPLLNPNGAALAFVTFAAVVAIVLLHRRSERVTVAAVMTSAVALVLPQELRGASLVAAYALLAAGSILVERRWLDLRVLLDVGALSPMQRVHGLGERALYGAGMVASLIGLWYVLSDHLPPHGFAAGLQVWAAVPTHPFFDDPTLVTAMIVAAAIAVAALAGDRMFRWMACVVAATAIAYLLPFEAGPAWSIAVWMGLAVALHALAGRWQIDGIARHIVTEAFAAAAAAEALLVVAAPDRLVVRPIPFPEPALFNGGTLAAAALMAGFAARALLPPQDRDARLAGLLAGAWGVDLLSIGAVDMFQANLGGTTALEELQKQAQVALSVLWAVLGVAAFVLGLVRDRLWARVFGLGLLAIVTAKVFVVDLAALDVAYRVLSFVALGLLLLGAAYLASRLQPKRRKPLGPMPGAEAPDPASGKANGSA